MTCTLPLVKHFGDDQAAWAKAMAIWAAAALVLLLLCFLRCEETVKLPAREQARKISMGESLRVLLTNPYFWAVTALWMFQSVSSSISGTILPYYCKYIFHNDTWMYSTLYLMETLILMGCIFACAPLIRKFGKRNTALAGAAIALAGQLLFCLNPHSFSWVVMSCVTRAVGLAPLNAAVFGMVGDVVEYGQYRSHVRQESLIFAGGSVGMKVGAGIAAAAMTSLLSGAGYVSSAAAGTAQPDSTLLMIINIYRVGPLLVAAGAIAVLLFYRLDGKFDAIMEELKRREKKGEL